MHTKDQNQPVNSPIGEFPVPSPHSSQSNLIIRVVICLSVLLTVLPIANILYILVSTGVNNVSNDYALFLPMIDKILSGSYAWSHFFQDSFNVSHFQPLPILVHLSNALLTDWNTYYELLFIAFISVIRLLFTYEALTCLSSRGMRAALMPILAILVFSTSQISSFEFGASAVREGLTAFGITLGILGLVKYKQPAAALTVMVVGGWIASWTAAPGIIAWFAFLIGMVLLGYKKTRHYFAWLIAAVLVNFPYLYYLLLNRKSGVNASLHSFFDPRLVVNMLGRPFANGIGKSTGYLPLGEVAGWLGLILGGVGVVLVVIFRKRLLAAASPAVMFMLYGLFTAWQTSIFRVLIAPWYNTMVMSYWIGLAGLAYLLAASFKCKNIEDPPGPTWKGWILRIYPLIVLVVMAGLYLNTNLTYRDKSFYLVSRSPASAACLRNYEWAPTYCERSVFQWTVNRVYLADFAWLLQRHQLNVFATNQRWTMQGDMVLGSVFSPEAPNTLGVEWYDGLPGTPSSFSDYRHLNLKVNSAQSAVWRVNLPDHLVKAEFSSATAVWSGDQEGSWNSPLTFEVYIAQANEPEKLVFTRTYDPSEKGWSKFKLDLLAYQGQEITLRLAIQGESDLSAALYRYPTIDLTLRSAGLLTERPAVRPVNAGLTSRSPKPTSSDHLFSLQAAQRDGLEPVGDSVDTWHVQPDPHFYLTLDDPISLQGFGWISFKLAASPDIPSRAAKVYLYFEGQDLPANLLIPLMPDGETYTYSYPLRMVDIPSRLVALRLYPVLLPSARGENIVKIEDLRLIRAP